MGWSFFFWLSYTQHTHTHTHTHTPSSPSFSFLFTSALALHRRRDPGSGRKSCSLSGVCLYSFPVWGWRWRGGLCGCNDYWTCVYRLEVDCCCWEQDGRSCICIIPKRKHARTISCLVFMELGLLEGRVGSISRCFTMPTV